MNEKLANLAPSSFSTYNEEKKEVDSMKKTLPNQAANTMLSNTFEIFHVKDEVKADKTLYHYHDFYEINCTLDGESIFYLDGKEYHLKPGSILFIHYNDLHRLVKQTTAKLERTYIFVTAEYLKKHTSSQSPLEQCFKAFGQPHSQVLDSDVNELRHYLKRFDEPPSQDFGADLLYHQAFIELMVFFNRLAIRQAKNVLPIETANSVLIQDLMIYVSNNLANDLSLDTVAQTFFHSKYYLSREFKRQTGFTFHQYVLKKRLLYSKQLLRKNKLATEVYLACGFRSYTHFLRSFKQEFDMTPKEFIKKESTFIQFEHH